MVIAPMILIDVHGLVTVRALGVLPYVGTLAVLVAIPALVSLSRQRTTPDIA